LAVSGNRICHVVSILQIHNGSRSMVTNWKQCISTNNWYIIGIYMYNGNNMFSNLDQTVLLDYCKNSGEKTTNYDIHLKKSNNISGQSKTGIK